MANPSAPTDGGGLNLGFYVHKAGTTLTACLARAFGKSATTGATDAAHLAVATGEEAAAVASADGGIVPYVLVGGRDPSGNGLAFRANADRSVPITGELASMAALADAYANPTSSHLGAMPHLFNGTTWDRERGNEQGAILASAARTATPTAGADTTNYNARALKVWVNVTATATTPSITVDIQEKDPVSGAYRSILISAAITGVGLTLLQVGPELTAAANLVAKEYLPRTWRVVVTHGDADSITYSVGYATNV